MPKVNKNNGSVYAFNKKAGYDYEILEKYQAGICLKGYEVKSIKTGHINLAGAFVVLKQGVKELPEAYLINAHIPLYQYAGLMPGYHPDQSRKLLLRKKEIRYLLGKKQTQGLTLIPLKVYNNNNLVKLEFALAKGKKKVDKRETIKKRETDMEMKRSMKRYKV